MESPDQEHCSHEAEYEVVRSKLDRTLEVGWEFLTVSISSHARRRMNSSDRQIDLVGEIRHCVVQLDVPLSRNCIYSALERSVIHWKK